MPARAFLLLLALCSYAMAGAQAIRGEVLDMDGKRPIPGVTIENVHTSLEITTGAEGAFLIAAAGGHLLEFKKAGYKTARVRIPQGYIPPFFRIIMSKGITEINDMSIASNRYNYRQDSLRYYELYKNELSLHRMSTLEVISHPFSAMSKRSREIWAFQDTYAEFEKEKYVDRTFNPAVVTKFTGLNGDSLQAYMRRFRPTYEQLRSMNDYAFFNYIKVTVHSYRSYVIPRGAQ